MRHRNRNREAIEPFEASWRARFEGWAAAREDDAGIAGWTTSGLNARVRRFVGLWKPRGKGERWLDAGCGAGTYTRLLLAEGADVVGVDYSVPTTLRAQSRSSTDAAYVAADVRHLPFQPQSFDGVLCFGVMQALSDAAPALSELVAQVRPGGQIWIDALNRWCIVHAWDQFQRRLSGKPIHLRYESPWTIRSIMNSHGLKQIQIHWMPIAPARWPRLQSVVESTMAQWIFRHVPAAGLILCHAFIVSGTRMCD